MTREIILDGIIHVVDGDGRLVEKRRMPPPPPPPQPEQTELERRRRMLAENNTYKSCNFC